MSFIKVRRSWDRLIFVKGILYLKRRSLYWNRALCSATVANSFCAIHKRWYWLLKLLTMSFSAIHCSTIIRMDKCRATTTTTTGGSHLRVYFRISRKIVWPVVWPRPSLYSIDASTLSIGETSFYFSQKCTQIDMLTNCCRLESKIIHKGNMKFKFKTFLFDAKHFKRQSVYSLSMKWVLSVSCRVMNSRRRHDMEMFEAPLANMD